MIDFSPQSFFDLEGFAHLDLMASDEPVWAALGNRLANYLDSWPDWNIDIELAQGVHLLGDRISIATGCSVEPGAVIVDVSIDQGGAFETSRPTTHAEPTYIIDGVVHYCVTNMPGAVGRTSTYALCNVTFPYALRLANHGLHAACRNDRGLAAAVNMHAHRVTNQAVYKWLEGHAPRPARAIALVEMSCGRLTLEAIYEHSREVRQSPGAGLQAGGGREPSQR